MSKVGTLKRLNNRANADGSDAESQTYQDSDGRYYHYDIKNSSFREVFVDSPPTDWKKLEND